MHFTHDFIPLQLYYQLYGSLLLVGFFGACVSFCLAMMTINGTGGIEVAMSLSCVGFFGLVRILMPLWTSMTDEDLYYSLDTNRNDNCGTKSLDDLAVDTMILEKSDKDNVGTLFISPSIQDSTCCSVCLQCFEYGQEISVTACKHTFHSACLQKWIHKSATCPYCRQDLEKKNPKEEESENGRRRKLAGALGMFEGVFESIYDFT